MYKYQLVCFVSVKCLFERSVLGVFLVWIQYESKRYDENLKSVEVCEKPYFIDPVYLSNEHRNSCDENIVGTNFNYVTIIKNNEYNR